MSSAAKNGKYEICLNRKSAIEKAISMAKNDDIVLIFGVEYFFGKDRKKGTNPYLVAKNIINK